MSACICKSSWRNILKKCEHLIDKRFKDDKGNEYIFFGVVHGSDDYYYGMCSMNKTTLLSCVGSIEGHGFTLVETEN